MRYKITIKTVPDFRVIFDANNDLDTCDIVNYSIDELIKHLENIKKDNKTRILSLAKHGLVLDFRDYPIVVHVDG